MYMMEAAKRNSIWACWSCTLENECIEISPCASAP